MRTGSALHRAMYPPQKTKRELAQRFHTIIKRIAEPHWNCSPGYVAERTAFGLELIDLSRSLFTDESFMGGSDDAAMDLLIAYAENASLSFDLNKKDEEIAALKKQLAALQEGPR